MELSSLHLDAGMRRFSLLHNAVSTLNKNFDL